MTEKLKKIIDLYQTFLFLSKIIEKVISIRILGHILDNNIVDCFQSAYSCEIALLRWQRQGNGSFLILLDLYATFDTIDYDNLFYILVKYVGIRGGSTLKSRKIFFHHYCINNII